MGITAARLAPVILLLVLLGPRAAEGQGRDAQAARTLNGHRFVLSSRIDDPFITTMVRTQTGGGFATKVARDVESEVLDSLVSSLVGDLAFMGLGFEFQYAPTAWLALSTSASGLARLGTGAESVLAQGVTSGFGFEFRAAARILQRERWILSGTLRAEPSPQYRLDILTFAKRAIEEGKIAEDNSVVIRSEAVGMALGLRGAYAPRAWLGFILGGEAGYSDTFQETEGRNVVWRLGGQASFDLDPLTGIPLGFLATAQEDGFVLNASDLAKRTRALGFGVAYTGREDFSLSLEVSRMRVPLIQSDSTINAASIDFNIRYFF